MYVHCRDRINILLRGLGTTKKKLYKTYLLDVLGDTSCDMGS